MAIKKALYYVPTALTILSLVAGAAYGQSPININPNPSLGVLGPKDVEPQNVVKFIINALILIGVIASLIFLIYGGIRWIISGGDKTAVDTARQHVVSAIIGLVIIVLSFVIINFVLFFLTGRGLTSDLPLPSLRTP